MVSQTILLIGLIKLFIKTRDYPENEISSIMVTLNLPSGSNEFCYSQKLWNGIYSILSDKTRWG